MRIFLCDLLSQCIYLLTLDDFAPIQLFMSPNFPLLQRLISTVSYFPHRAIQIPIQRMHFTLLFTLPLPTLFASPLLITSLQNPLSTQSANVPVIPAWPASYKFQQTLKGIARQTTLYTYPHWKTSVHAFGERAGAVQTFTQDTDGRRTFTTYIWVKGEGCKMILVSYT